MASLNSAQEKSPRVAIIGGGYAGMSAAVSLIDAGIKDLTVYEAGPVLGGRARRIPGGNSDDDNGQHLCLGAYTELLKLMVNVGCDPEQLFYRSPLRLLFQGLATSQNKKIKQVFSLRANPFLPAPFNLISGILLSSGVSISDRGHTLLALNRLKRRSYLCTSGQTVSNLLNELDIQGALRSYFWESLCLAALNTHPNIACAQTFLNILQDIAEGPRQASDVLIPKVDLSRLFPEPAARYIQDRGAEVLSACAIKTLEPAGQLLRVVGSRHQRLYHHVILAVPPRAASVLLSGWGESMNDLGHQLHSLPHEKIATLTLDYFNRSMRLPFPMMGIANSSIEWIFDRGYLLQANKGSDSWNRAALQRKFSRFTCVISAPHEDTPLEKQALTRAAHACVQALCGTPIIGTLTEPDSSRLVVEKFATLSCRPNSARPHALTPDKRLILAGDYLQSRYPSTLETAVRSGLEAAALTLKHI